MKHQFIATLLIFFGLIASAWSQNGVIRGSVVDAANNDVIMFANVVVVGLETGGTTDLDGNYEITNLDPGLYDIRVSYIGYKDATAYEVQVSNARPAEVNFRLEETAAELMEVVVKAPAFRKTQESPVSLRTIGVAEIQRNPGGNRDISKVVQSLPGVTSTASFRNDLIIRGGAPNENRFFLDDVEVPNINHFATQGSSGGPVGLINVSFINEVDFFSGAFPANRGNALSSVFNFRQRDGRSDRFGATLMVGASDLGVTMEGPIGRKATYLVSARRSYLQLLFQALQLPFLPNYNDAQFKIKYKIDQKNEIYLIGLGALDQVVLNLDANETEEQQYLLDQLPVTPQWNYTNGLVYKHYAKKGLWTFVLSRNMLNNRAEKYYKNDDSKPDNLILEYQSREIENKVRLEHSHQLGKFKLLGGAGYEGVKYTNSTFNRIFTSEGARTVDYSSSLNFQKYFIFGQLSRQLFNDRLVLSMGVRFDGNDYSMEMSSPLEHFAPRFSLAYALTDRFSLNFNTGRYYQLPPYTVMGYEQDDQLINREMGLDYIQSDHLVAGLEYNTKNSSRITVEGYYKHYRDYPFLLRDSLTLANLGGDFGVIGNEPAVSRSEGRTYGLEVLFQQRLFKGFYGIASYTLGWSQFQDKKGDFVASSWDARHIVNFVLGKKFKGNWEVGINWRFQSGRPYSPYSDASSLVLNWQVNNRGIPDYDRLNTLRTKANNTIDIRVDKKWFFKKWNLELYLDVENVTANAEGIPALILDRPLDENGTPYGDPTIINPEAPIDQQRYLLKEIGSSVGTPIPSIGIMIEI